MLKEKVLVLTNNDAGTDERHSSNAFFDLVKKQYGAIHFYDSADVLVKDIEMDLAGTDIVKTTLYILFIHSNSLESIHEYLEDRLNPSSYILISYASLHRAIDPTFRNVFEFLNTKASSNHIKCFFNKLCNEISLKNKLALLQFEVKEFYEIGKSLSTEKDTIKLLEMIISSSLSLTSSDAGTIYLVIDKATGNWSSLKDGNCGDKLLKFAISKNTSMDLKLEASTSPILMESIFGYAVLTGKSLRIDDAYELSSDLEYKHNQSYDLSTGYRTKSMLSIPMKDHANNVMGVIQLINKKKVKNTPLDFSDPNLLQNIITYDYTDELIMNSLAGQAAVALENNLLYRDMHSLLLSYKEQNSQLEFLSRNILKAHEEERRRIAREIHDGPAQSVVNLSLKLDLCKRFLQKGLMTDLSEQMNILHNSIRSTSKEIRTIIYDLKPSYLEDGLIKVIENYLGIYSENTGIKTSFVAKGDDSAMEYYLVSTLYRVVQEALSNAYKHADADKVGVVLNISESGIHIEINDNGKGFEPLAVSRSKKRTLEGGFGLEGIRERIEIIKGQLKIKSSPNKGTSIIIEVPA